MTNLLKGTAEATEARPPVAVEAPALATSLSVIDGRRGTLHLRGRSIEELAEGGLEATALFLANGREATPEERRELREQLGRARFEAWRMLSAADRSSGLATLIESSDDACRAIRLGLAGLAGLDQTARNAEHEPGELIPGVAGAAKVGLLAALWLRRKHRRSDGPRLKPNPERGHAEDLLHMVRGDTPSADEIRAFETYLATIMEHGLNASTFTARVVASTAASTEAAISAGLGSLSGPLHGGAPGPVLDLLDAIGEPNRAEACLRAELAAGRRIMGFGHRVYRVRDPRAAVLFKALDRLVKDSPRARLAKAVEHTAERVLAEHRPGRELRANVEFATAVLLEQLGFPRESFTAIFACGRVFGWLAHIEEQRRTGRLIRPVRSVEPAPPA